MNLTDTDLHRQQCCIGGNWCDASSGATTAVTNPADGTAIGSVPAMSAADVATATAAAHAAFPAWRDTTAAARAAILRRWFNLMLEHADDLAALMTAEQGKPLAEARGEVTYAAAFLEWFAEEGKRVYGETIPAHQSDKRIVVLRQPIGVTAAITPWNFPAAMITRKAAPALAAGCTMVVKPATQTPFSALALAVLAERAGVPGGVFNVITGSGSEVGGALADDTTVRKLSFTGSTAVGKELMARCAGNVKKISLELGGNAPFIVFDDADVDAAVDGAMLCKFRNTGQTCVCANRIYVQDGVYEQFSRALVERAAALKVGDGFSDGVGQGPLIDEAALLKVEEHVADATAHGAELLTGGARHKLGGTFYQPTVLGGVTDKMKIADEETFGPVAPLFRFSNEEDAIAAANATPFGLAAYFYSRDLGRVWRVAEGLESGIVGINTGIISTEVAPFGGVKESGIGREGSRLGIDEFLEVKYLCMGVA